jgi:serine/threonine protein kinase
MAGRGRAVAHVPCQRSGNRVLAQSPTRAIAYSRSMDMIGTTIGEYQVLDHLGAGGMGEVYRAVHSKIGRVVAIKVLTSAGHNPAMTDRFLNEARIQAGLHHPNIATLYDFCEFRGQPCIIMEYVDGQTLEMRIKSLGRLPPSEAIFIIQAVAEAIYYIHVHGIVHRDIKSNNIKITSAGAVKLLDFGIAKSSSTPSLTLDGSVVGTLQYLSPEQIRGGSADARSDIWALGVVLYEMVTGCAPFEATTIGDLCDKITKASYTPPSVLNAGLPREIETLIARCLKKNPSDRYQSTHEMLRQVMEVAKKVSTPRLSSVDQRLLGSGGIVTWASKHAILLAVAAVLVLALGIGIYLIMDSSPPDPKPAEVIVPKPTPRSGSAPARDNDPVAADRSKTIQINVEEGPADVYQDGSYLGKTPLNVKASVGDSVNLLLKRDGFEDKRVQFAVTANQRGYTLQMEKKR